MITVLLINLNAEVKILKYATDTEEEACRLLLQDWKTGKVEWEFEDTNKAFTPEWLEKCALDPVDNLSPEYENGVRVMEWDCMTGPKESDDEIVRGYFLHTIR